MAYGRQFDAAARRARDHGTAAGDQYLERAQSFDPYAAMRTAAGGFYDSMQTQMGEDMQTLRGNMAGTGRLQSGVGERDENRMVRGHYDRLNQVLAQNAMGAAGMELSNNQGLGQYAQNQQSLHMDALSGQMDRETAQKNAKRSMWGGIAGAALGAAGMALGGPAGGAAGNWLGRTLGG